jgi:glucose-1-phosphate adenylyltransferase
MISRARLLSTTMTLVLAGGQGERLYPLTRDRAKPAVPFGGIYRIIDFTLSNCVNSALRRIFVLTQYKSHSLDRHLKLGWNIFSSELGEYLYTIPPQLKTGEKWYAGTADAVFQNINLLEDERPKRVLILSGDHVYKMNYYEMLHFHEERKADLTVASVEMDAAQASRMGVLQVDGDRHIVQFLEKPEQPPSIPGKDGRSLVNMGVYVFNTDALVRAIVRDARLDSKHDFGHDIIPALVAEGRRVYAFDFADENRPRTNYWRDIGTLDSYYEASMDLVSVTPEFNLYDEIWPVRTHQRQYPPAKFVFGQEEKGWAGRAIDSIVSGGCILSGGRVERSILSPMVRVESYARVEDSILMDHVEVGPHARLRRVIADKGTRIPAGCQIGFDPEKDRRHFSFTESGIVVIPKNEFIEV